VVKCPNAWRDETAPLNCEQIIELITFEKSSASVDAKKRKGVIGRSPSSCAFTGKYKNIRL